MLFCVSYQNSVLDFYDVLWYLCFSIFIRFTLMNVLNSVFCFIGSLSCERFCLSFGLGRFEPF